MLFDRLCEQKHRMSLRRISHDGGETRTKPMTAEEYRCGDHICRVYELEFTLTSTWSSGEEVERVQREYNEVTFRTRLVRQLERCCLTFTNGLKKLYQYI